MMKSFQEAGQVVSQLQIGLVPIREILNPIQPGLILLSREKQGGEGNRAFPSSLPSRS